MLAFGRWLASLITGPIISAGLDAYKEKLKAGTSQNKIRGDLVAREIELQSMESRLRAEHKLAQIGYPWEPEKLFAYILIGYFAKAVFFDKVIGSFAGYTDTIFTTDPLTGDVLQWAGMIMLYFFGVRGIKAAIQLWLGTK